MNKDIKTLSQIMNVGKKVDRYNSHCETTKNTDEIMNIYMYVIGKHTERVSHYRHLDGL